ncbi:hypothetical protein CC99x_009405 [Candidatus Berkiella cookevillensis]|uniref:Uncharacterized protein n=1 Tax=Candidatus Berkiella cookevillensis TaxID=437022 RepID=A0A0Q9YBG2_9GAMM|nr:hypothetical protein [Candidatus Berkiella cookevillensis]MCS5709120.1 hypothetical protein [Candidatus Berkiella cookevillensis]
MSKSTEGVVIPSNQNRSFHILPEHIEQELSAAHIPLASLLKIARSQFVQDVKKAIGVIANQSLPLSVVPALEAVLLESDHYLEHGNESSFVHTCERAIHVCGQGWNYLSYWVSTEQSTCYSIFWGLKAAIEKHNKYMVMYQGSKNDGQPKNDPFLPKKENNNIAQLLEWRKKLLAKASHQQAPSKLMDILKAKAKKFQENLHNNLSSNSAHGLDRYLYVRQKVRSEKQK